MLHVCSYQIKIKYKIFKNITIVINYILKLKIKLHQLINLNVVSYLLYFMHLLKEDKRSTIKLFFCLKIHNENILYNDTKFIDHEH